MRIRRVRAYGIRSVVGALAIAAAPSAGDEIVLQNDGLGEGDQATICPCFVQGEEAAVWLTSPCDGSIVAIQIFWRSQLGGAAVVVEDSITVYEGGSFPTPGPIKDVLLAPALQDGGLNEFRFEDQNQTIPIDIPVSAGEEFVVSLEFFNDSPGTGPSILFDNDGITPASNAVKLSNNVWASAGSLGVTGDWIIRAVVDCAGASTGSACLPDGSCVEGLTEDEALMMGGVWNGAGTDCSTPCVGACFVPSTGNCLQDFEKGLCDAVGGDWQGPGTTGCTACPGDLTGDGEIQFDDVNAFTAAFSSGDLAADLDGNGSTGFEDLNLFVGFFATGCP